MRTFYSEYVQHCMRFYARHPSPDFRNDIDKENWNACNKAIKTFSERDKAILMYVYRERDTITDNVYNVSLELNVKQDSVWKLISELERKVAAERKLA